MGTDNDVFSKKNWTWSDYDYLCANHAKKGLDELGKTLDRSSLSVREKLRGMGLGYDVTITPDVVKMFRTFGDALGPAAIFLFPNLSVQSLEVVRECALKQV